MSTDLTPLAARRAELVARCAEQRALVAQELAALKSPETLGGITGFVASHKTTTLAVVGVAIGLMATRPKRVMAAAAGALSLYKMVRGVLAQNR